MGEPVELQMPVRLEPGVQAVEGVAEACGLLAGAQQVGGQARDLVLGDNPQGAEPDAGRGEEVGFPRPASTSDHGRPR